MFRLDIVIYTVLHVYVSLIHYGVVYGNYLVEAEHSHGVVVVVPDISRLWVQFWPLSLWDVFIHGLLLGDMTQVLPTPRITSSNRLHLVAIDLMK